MDFFTKKCCRNTICSLENPHLPLHRVDARALLKTQSASTIFPFSARSRTNTWKPARVGCAMEASSRTIQEQRSALVSVTDGGRSVAGIGGKRAKMSERASRLPLSCILPAEVVTQLRPFVQNGCRKCSLRPPPTIPRSESDTVAAFLFLLRRLMMPCMLVTVSLTCGRREWDHRPS